MPKVKKMDSIQNFFLKADMPICKWNVKRKVTSVITYFSLNYSSLCVLQNNNTGFITFFY